MWDQLKKTAWHLNKNKFWFLRNLISLMESYKFFFSTYEGTKNFTVKEICKLLKCECLWLIFHEWKINLWNFGERFIFSFAGVELALFSTSDEPKDIFLTNCDVRFCVKCPSFFLSMESLTTWIKESLNEKFMMRIRKDDNGIKQSWYKENER